MEKIFGEKQIEQSKQENTKPDRTGVWLKKQHLWLSAEVANETFQEERQVYVVYYEEPGSLMLAPMSDDMFKQVHKCSLVILKDRNLKGDKTISLQEVIIDNDLDPADRSLEYTSAPGLNILQVKLK
jgi:hypothetical protein